MKICPSEQRQRLAGVEAFTLIEVVVSMAIAVLVCAAIMKCYTMSSRRSFYASCNLAANAQAMKKMEQVIYARWRPSIGVTDIFNTALTNNDYENLEMPVSSTNVITCTNFTTVKQISTNPPYLMIRVDCVFNFLNISTFTNTIAVLRGPDF
jgi:type II secretory pathway pseudopilin PulG